MAEVDAIMEFALPRFQAMLTEGQQRWADIAKSLTLAPVGLAAPASGRRAICCFMPPTSPKRRFIISV